MPKLIHKINQFHGGLSTNSDPRDIADNEISTADDVMVDELGKIRTMGGTIAHAAHTPTVVTGIEPGYGLFYFSHDRKGAHVQVSDLSGTHTGSANQDGTLSYPLVDAVSIWPVDALIGATLNNTTDASNGTIDGNTATTVSVDDLTGGDGDDWDTTDAYTITNFPETGDDYLVLANTDVFTDATCDYNDAPTIAHDDDSGAIKVGMSVSGTGIPTGAYVATHTSDTAFELSTATTGGAVTDGTLTFGGGIYIYSRSGDKWSLGEIINLGATTGMKPTFYNVDGVLRISDGNFGSGNSNRWYGYIKREFLGSTEGNEVIVNRWVNADQKIEKPATASVFNDTKASVSPTYSTSGTIAARTGGSLTYFQKVHFDTEDTIYDKSGTIANVMKIAVRVTAEAEGSEDNGLQYTLKVGMSADATTTATTFSSSANEYKSTSASATVSAYSSYDETHTFTFDVNDLVMANGETGTGIRSYANFYGTGGDIATFSVVSVTVTEGTAGGTSHTDLEAGSCHFELVAGGTDGIGWDKEWNIGCSFIYDGVQESLITELADVDDSTDTDLAALGETQHPEIKLNIDYNSGWNERVTGINLYMREASTTTTANDWYLQCSYDLIKGTGRQYPNGVTTDFIYVADHDEYSCEITRDKLKSPNTVSSFQINSGMNPDEESIISKYKTAVVAGRITYIAGLELQKEDGTTEVKGDAMIKCPVNKFDVFPLSRLIEASVNDGDDIIKLEVYADRILQFKKNKMHLINISQEIEFLEDTFMHKGVSHPAATCKTDYGIAWVNSLGCYLYDGQKVTNLLEKGGRQIIKEEDWDKFLRSDKSTSGTRLTPMIGYVPRKRQLVIFDDITSGGESTPYMYLYDLVTQSWVRGAYDSTTRIIDAAKTNFINDWDGDLVYSFTTGSVFKWDDTGVATDTMNFKTKDIDFGQPAQAKKIYKIMITHKSAGIDKVRLMGEIMSRVATSAQGAGELSNDFTFSNLTQDSGQATNWITEVFTPPVTDVSGNTLTLGNIYSIRLYLKPVSGQTVPAGFEVNDISIVYRLKPVK